MRILYQEHKNIEKFTNFGQGGIILINVRNLSGNISMKLKKWIIFGQKQMEEEGLKKKTVKVKTVKPEKEQASKEQNS